MRKNELIKDPMDPAPNAYHILGDFDFKDQSLPDGEVLHDRGKNPRFAFAKAADPKNLNMEIPGPGTYEVDQCPLNQKNIGFFFGNDLRRDMSIPFSHLYPGPGSYFTQEKQNTGPHIR